LPSLGFPLYPSDAIRTKKKQKQLFHMKVETGGTKTIVESNHCIFLVFPKENQTEDHR